MYKLYLKNRNKDFLILLNTYLLSSLEKEEIFLSVAHEALHYVNTCLGNRLTYKEVEDNARVIVGEFLSSS